MGHSLLDLPPDVLARTLGLLANDLPALAACCAASHSLCTAAGYILAQLQSLTLRGGAARSPALAALLPRTRSLASLDLSHCYGWLDPEACRLVASIPTLHTLKLDGCRGVTRAGLAELCSGQLHNLKVLSLRSVGEVGPGSELAGLPSLTHLDLAWCGSIRGQQLVPFADRLQEVSLKGCDTVDDAVCAALSSAVHVDLALTRVSDTGLMALAAGSPLLCRLVLSPCDSYNLWGTGRWTAAGLEAFRRLRPEVAVVTVEC